MTNEQTIEYIKTRSDGTYPSVGHRLPDDLIIRNSIRTPDGTEIVSRHQHDYVTHKDANGETYMVDGGTAYMRRNVNKEKAMSTSIMLWHGHSIVREVFTWGSRGPNGDQPIKRIKLSDMDNEHLQAIIDDGYNMWPLMQAELDWREDYITRELVYRADIDRLYRLIEENPDMQDMYAEAASPIIMAYDEVSKKTIK